MNVHQCLYIKPKGSVRWYIEVLHFDSGAAQNTHNLFQ